MFVSSKNCYNVSKEFAPGTSTSPRAHKKVTLDFRCHINHHARYGTAEEGTESSKLLNYRFNDLLFFLAGMFVEYITRVT